MAPTSMILGSDFTTWTASRMVGFASSLMLLLSFVDFSPLLSLFAPPPPPATFSFHMHDASTAPMTRNPTDNSKGPVGPRVEAAMPAICPARIATNESPAYACHYRWMIEKFECTIHQMHFLIPCSYYHIGFINIQANKNDTHQTKRFAQTTLHSLLARLTHQPCFRCTKQQTSTDAPHHTS